MTKKFFANFNLNQHGARSQTEETSVGSPHQSLSNFQLKINDGTYGNYKKFLKILEMYLVSLGISQAKQILFIADGAEWIWQHIPPLLNRLGCEKITHYLLDFYHEMRTFTEFCRCCF